MGLGYGQAQGIQDTDSVTTGSDGVLASLLLTERAAPATPASGFAVLYADATGQPRWIDDGGTDSALIGGGENLAQTLALGTGSGTNDIDMEAAQQVTFGGDVGVIRDSAGRARVTDGAAGDGELEANRLVTDRISFTQATEFVFLEQDASTLGIRCANAGGNAEFLASTISAGNFATPASVRIFQLNTGGINLGASRRINWHEDEFVSGVQDLFLERASAGQLDVNATVSGGGDGIVNADSYIMGDGSVGTPALRFASALTTGLFLSAAALRFAVTTEVLNLSSSLATYAVPINMNSSRIEGYARNVVIDNTSTAASPRVLTNTVSAQLTISGPAAAEEVHVDLPSAAAGLQYLFMVGPTGVGGLQVNAATGDTIRIGGTVSASGGFVSSTTVGDVLWLVAVDSTQWVSFAPAGSWTFDV